MVTESTKMKKLDTQATEVGYSSPDLDTCFDIEPSFSPVPDSHAFANHEPVTTIVASQGTLVLASKNLSVMLYLIIISSVAILAAMFIISQWKRSEANLMLNEANLMLNQVNLMLKKVTEATEILNAKKEMFFELTRHRNWY